MSEGKKRKVWVRRYVARLIGCSEGHIDYLRREGKLKSFEPEDVRKFLIEREKSRRSPK